MTVNTFLLVLQVLILSFINKDENIIKKESDTPIEEEIDLGLEETIDEKSIVEKKPKKQIKKTSFKDILKGSYLTNVLKNVSSMLRTDRVVNVLYDPTGIPQTILGDITKLNNQLVTLIRKALSVL